MTKEVKSRVDMRSRDDVSIFDWIAKHRKIEFNKCWHVVVQMERLG